MSIPLSTTFPRISSRSPPTLGSGDRPLIEQLRSSARYTTSASWIQSYHIPTAAVLFNNAGSEWMHEVTATACKLQRSMHVMRAKALRMSLTRVSWYRSVKALHAALCHLSWMENQVESSEKIMRKRYVDKVNLSSR